MISSVGALEILILFGALQGFGLVLFFGLRGTGDRQANLLLAAVVLTISYNLAELSLFSTGLILKLPHLMGLGFPLFFLIGPCYYLYLRRLLNGGFRFSWRTTLHGLPALHVFIHGWSTLTAPVERKLAWARYWIDNPQIEIGGMTKLLIFSNLLQGVFYLWLCIRRIAERERMVRTHAADNRLMGDLRTLRRISTGFGLYLILHALALVGLLIWSSYGILIDKIWYLLVALFIQLTAFTAMRRPETFPHGLRAPSVAEHSTDPLKPDPAKPGKYRRSTLGSEEAKRQHARLLDYLRRERPYLDRSLKLSAVASKLSLSTHHLSQVINQETGRNFFELINELRVEESKRLLRDPDQAHLTILGIAFQAGFNSKGSFNQAFKKYVGQTPSTFRKA